MKGKMRKVVSLVLSTIMVIATMQYVPENVSADEHTLSAPIVNDGVVTWDCVWFGNYPQKQVTDLTDDITTATYDENGEAVIDGVKYRRLSESDASYTSTQSSYFDWSSYGDNNGYHYFKYQPIKWRILSIEGDNAFLLADVALDDKKYHNSYQSMTWEESHMRSYLNNSFLNSAFTTEEQAGIYNTTVVNEDSPYGSYYPGGKTTTDKIYLLSYSELQNTSYGFKSSYTEYDRARRAKASDYAHAMGAFLSPYTSNSEYIDNCIYWVRTPGNGREYAIHVDVDGHIERYGTYINAGNNATRPVLHLDLSKTELYSYAGTVNSNGVEEEQGGEVETFTISFDANGGTGSIAEETVTEGEEFTLPLCTFTAPSGKYFKTWAIGSANSATTVDPGEQYTFTENTTVYAVWENEAPVRSVNLMKDGKVAGISDPKIPETTKSLWTGSYVYFGGHDTDTDGNLEPILFRVLDANTTDYSEDDTSVHTMFLDSDRVLEARQPKNATWFQSDIRRWMNNSALWGYETTGFLSGFNSVERDSIAESTRTNSSNLGVGYYAAGFVSISGDKVFALDAREVSNPAYGYYNTEGNTYSRDKELISSDIDAWYLRSKTSSNIAPLVTVHTGSSDRSALSNGVLTWTYGYGVAPALNLKVDSILFTTVAGKHKPETLAMTDDEEDSNIWNLTLKGGTGFTATVDNDIVAPGGKVTANVTSLGKDLNNTAVDEDYYSQISAMIVDEDGNVEAYGQIKDGATDGKATFKIPKTLGVGDYTLYIFAEKANSVETLNASDYASNFAVADLKVEGDAIDDEDEEILLAEENDLKIEGFQIRTNLQETNIAYRTVCKAPNRGSTITVNGTDYIVDKLGTVYVCDPGNKTGDHNNDTISPKYTILDSENVVSGRQYSYVGKTKYNNTSNITYGYNVLDEAILSGWNQSDTTHTYYAITMQGMNNLIANSLYVRAYVVATDGTIIYSNKTSITSVAQIANYLYVNNYSNNIFAHNYLFDAILNNNLLKTNNNIYYREDRIEYGWDKNLFSDITLV